MTQYILKSLTHKDPNKFDTKGENLIYFAGCFITFKGQNVN